MNIKPIGERVLIKPVKEEETTAGGIYIPETAKEKKKQGVVMEIGTCRDDNEMPVQKGDLILYTGYSTEELKMDGEELLIINISDIIAKLE
ncbi:MAG: 10 kDa chaperonin [ANME-2 cluster archaeon]|nr:10 kDa chaperonin [ANME-2 cluster archaeon]